MRLAMRQSWTAQPSSQIKRWCALFMYLVMLTIAPGCRPEAGDAVSGHAGYYMLPQAEGVRLGMSVAKLRNLRPGLIVDSYEVWEGVDSARFNTYWFAPLDAPEKTSKSPGPHDIVSAVLMEQSIGPGSEVAHDAQVSRIRMQWESRAGPASDSTLSQVRLVGNLDPAIIKRLIWRRPSVLLILEYRIDPAGVSPGRRIIRALVQEPEVPLSVTIPGAAATAGNQSQP